MGYLNNQVVTIDAILTKKGRELLAAGDGGFNITQYALSDDEIDYTLYNPTHPSGAAYYGEAIENMPLLEAFPDETQIMKYKLATLPRGTARLPILNTPPSVVLQQLATQAITPTTLNYITTSEPSGYTFTVSDARLFSSFQGTGIETTNANALNAATTSTTNGTNVSQTVIGTTLTLAATGVNTLFGTQTSLYATLTIVGRDSGARVQVPITINQAASSTN
jgi:hypothetical protein|tara:strand:- start:496 stop:1161 length:666 start_codon:yes stop_codon:yes gene_type:complete